METSLMDERYYLEGKMVDKNDMNEMDDGFPRLDEGWWNSVLSDETSFLSETKPAFTKPNQPVDIAGVNWKRMKELYENDEIIELQVLGFNKGGLLVQGVDVQGFVPISHLINTPVNFASDDERNKFLEKYIGSKIPVKIIECEPANERIVFSERAAQAGEGKRKELFDLLKPGVITTGMITNVTEFGAFVDLGGVEGLIHVSEISWGRVAKPTDLLEVGSTIKVIVMQINPQTSRIALSIKRLTENPWEELGRKYQINDTVSATVTSIMKFGIFARLDEGIEGLIHISSMPEEIHDQDLRTVFSAGQVIAVKILHIDVERRRLGLGLVLET
jgi:small subunit ribosomal protein S1